MRISLGLILALSMCADKFRPPVPPPMMQKRVCVENIRKIVVRLISNRFPDNNMRLIQLKIVYILCQYLYPSIKIRKSYIKQIEPSVSSMPF